MTSRLGAAISSPPDSLPAAPGRMLGAMRIVLDTNVCLALFLYADPACAALQARLGVDEPVADARTRGEWLRVLADPRLPCDPGRRARAAVAFERAVRGVELPARAASLPRCRDPADQMFLERARDAGARVLYTRDGELLRLARRTRRTAGFDIRPPEHPVEAACAVATG